MVTINESMITGVDLWTRKDAVFVLQPPSVTLLLVKLYPSLWHFT